MVLRVLWIAPLPAPTNDGAHPAPWIESLSNILSEDIELTIVSIGKGKDESGEIAGAKFEFISGFGLLNKILLYIPNQILLNKWIRGNKDSFDLIHVHGTEHQFDYGLQKLGIPWCVSIQGVLIEYLRVFPKKNKRWVELSIRSIYEKRLFKKVPYLLGRTHWDNQVSKTHAPQAKYFYAPEAIRAEYANEYPISHSKSIVFLGGTNEFKGLDLFVETILALDTSLFDFFYVVGAINQRRLGRIMKNVPTKLKKKFVFTGMISSTDMINIYRNSFALVHPTLIDNSPNSICEAQLLGVPVIATDVGGVSSLISNNESGILVGPYANQLCDALTKLAIDYHFRMNIIHTARKKAIERHDQTSIRKIYLNIYTSIISYKNARSAC